jgi:hypothetical protein
MNEHERELCNLRLDLLTAHRETMEHAGRIIELERGINEMVDAIVPREASQEQWNFRGADYAIGWDDCRDAILKTIAAARGAKP